MSERKDAEALATGMAMSANRKTPERRGGQIAAAPLRKEKVARKGGQKMVSHELRRTERNAPEKSDKSYFVRRAEQELDRAQSSDHPGVVRSHYHMAALYLDLAYNDEAFQSWRERGGVDWDVLSSPPRALPAAIHSKMS
jgi:hypothetical protein